MAKRIVGYSWVREPRRFKCAPCIIRKSYITGGNRQLNDVLTRSVSLSVPGGVGGQLWAVCYAAWIFEKKGLHTQINFYNTGTAISGFGLAPLLETDAAKALGITYSQRIGSLDWNGNRRGTLTYLARQVAGHTKAWALFRDTLGAQRRSRLDSSQPFTDVKTGTITLETLQNLKHGEHLIGYPSDCRVIEEAWEMIPRMIEESGLPNFVKDTGTENSVAVHWRLGDYVDNPIHGSISWKSLEKCIDENVGRGLAVKIITDSPSLAEELVGDSVKSRSISFLSSDIWSDLFEMTRSKIFVGSHSAVSFLAALALRMDNPSAMTCLPDKWFLHEGFERQFVRTEITFGKSIIYPVDFQERSSQI